MLELEHLGEIPHVCRLSIPEIIPFWSHPIRLTQIGQFFIYGWIPLWQFNIAMKYHQIYIYSVIISLNRPMLHITRVYISLKLSFFVGSISMNHHKIRIFPGLNLIEFPPLSHLVGIQACTLHLAFFGFGSLWALGLCLTWRGEAAEATKNVGWFEDLRMISRGIQPFTRPGKHTKSYWKWPFIVDFPMKNGDFT